jgi:hypothetical protein
MGQERLHDKRNNMSQLQNQLIQVTPAKAKLHVHKAGVHKILKILDTVFRRYDAQGLLQLAHMSDLSGMMPKTSFFWDIRCRLLTDLYGQPFVNMKLRFPGWRASAKVCQFAAKHFLSLPPSRLLQWFQTNHDFGLR